MKNDRSILEKMIRKALTGKDSHVEVKKILEGLDWEKVGAHPEGPDHSIFQQLNHMSYWMDWVVRWLDREDPPIPEHASGSWPGAVEPENSRDWERALGHFKQELEGLDRRIGRADLFSTSGEKSRLEMLQIISAHNSYHLGQVVLMRQILGAWPPPSGGLTW